MDTYLTLFTSFIACAIGLGVGRIHQRLLDGIRIRALEGQRNDAYEEMAQQEWCCKRVGELEARVRELEARYAILVGIVAKELAEIDDDDEDDWDDDPDYIARVEDTLRNWGPIE